MHVPSYALPQSATKDGVIDLLDPAATRIDFREIAATLSCLARFGGRNGMLYSVAQHCVMGGEAILAEIRDPELARDCAAAFLLHDAHEAYLGDLQQPVMRLMQKSCGFNKGEWDYHKLHWDIVIYRAAQIPDPTDWSAEKRRIISEMDRRMADAEARALFNAPPIHACAPDLPPPKLNGAIKCWPPAKAAERWLDCFERWVGTPVTQTTTQKG